MPEDRILPPFPDDMITHPDKSATIAYLRGLGLPSRIASKHLGRWGKMTETEITPRDYRAVRDDLSVLEESE